jgi:hypoxanthine phosphoribosyltransferase
MKPDPDRMRLDLDRILISRERIAQRVRELARSIEQTYLNTHDDGLTFVTILSGSLIFLADLIRELPLRMKIGLVTVSSYRGTATQPGELKLLSDFNVDVRGRHVLLIDDILDTGGTLRMVRHHLADAGAKSIRTCVLLRKPSKAPADVAADFVGFDIEDAFVVGYGLDYNDHYRNLPDIGVLKRELYSE